MLTRYRPPRRCPCAVCAALLCRVVACTDGFKLWRHEGAYAELAAVPEAQLAAMPSNASFQEAGGLPLVALTAWQVWGAGVVRRQRAVGGATRLAGFAAVCL